MDSNRKNFLLEEDQDADRQRSSDTNYEAVFRLRCAGAALLPIARRCA
jgi:hypothetical protein